MAILPGKRLGPYEILSAIGAGGMGEVYKARDTRLDRTVAIKILPEHLADRPELRERFEREAKAIAGLNHPHICTLYDVGHENRAEFLVMEYLEGETLAQRLAKGALPVQQTLQYAIEIADALDKAHHKGITHRDLKPGNIMLTKTGTKLLDFGLAKLTQGAAPVTPESQMPTMKDAITAQGMILGTLQYMAPEQVEGKLDQIDARTDIFAFGVLAYEMTTGRKAFEGKTQASLIAKILEVDPPPISKLQPMTPPAFDRLVKVCLAKEPDDRWQTASDLRRELEWIWQGEADADGFNSVPKINRRQLFATAISSGVVTALLGLSIAHFREGSLVPEREVRTEINTPPTTDPFSFALSPDGSEIVFVASGDGPSGLWLRRLRPRLAQTVVMTVATASHNFYRTGDNSFSIRLVRPKPPGSISVLWTTSPQSGSLGLILRLHFCRTAGYFSPGRANSLPRSWTLDTRNWLDKVETVLGRFRPTADRERSISPAGSLDFLPLVHGLNGHLFPRSNAVQGHVIDAKKVAICSTDAVSTMGWAYDRGGGEGGIRIIECGALYCLA